VSLQRDTYEGRAEDVNEIYLASRLNLSDQWTANVNSRFNFDENTPVNTNLNLSYLNECLRFNLAFTRRHTSSVSFDPNTDFSLDMELLGFSNGSSRGNARQCGM
jgi:LPS-assembly protein